MGLDPKAHASRSARNGSRLELESGEEGPRGLRKATGRDGLGDLKGMEPDVAACEVY